MLIADYEAYFLTVFLGTLLHVFFISNQVAKGLMLKMV